MYYRLKEPWAFRGWKKLPFAIQAMEGEHRHEKPFLMEKTPFLDLLCCNGEEDVDVSSFSEAGRVVLKEMQDADMIESVHWSITGIRKLMSRATKLQWNRSKTSWKTLTIM